MYDNPLPYIRIARSLMALGYVSFCFSFQMLLLMLLSRIVDMELFSQFTPGVLV